MPIIFKAMDVWRANVRTEIEKKRPLAITSYSLKDAIGDAFRYHQGCTLRNGLDTAEETLSKRLKDLEAELKERLPKAETKPKEEAAGPAATPGGA